MKKIALLCILSVLAVQAVAQDLTALSAKLRYHVYYLADDSLSGRLTGTTGEAKAANYIVQEFFKIGLQPAGEKGDWLQPFSFTAKQAFGGTVVSFDKEKISFGTDYAVPAITATGSVSGKTVDVGYGIQNSQLKHDDYAGKKDLQGKVFFIRLGSPDGNNPHGKFGADATLDQKISLAKKMGAVGVVFYPTTSEDALPNDPLDRRTRAASLPAIYLKKPLTSKMPQEVSLKTEIRKTTTTGHNVAGWINNNANYTVVIGAHYDHLGDGSLGGSLSTAKKAIHNGADDNASGTAALIELARELKKRKDARFNYLFIAFSGEELGLLGSAYFAKNPTVAIDQVTCMLNMDMVGRLDSSTMQLGVHGVGTSPFWKEAVESQAGPLQLKTTESGTGSSDHTSFYLQNIPVLHFFTGTHRDYHKPEDDADKLNYKGQAEVVAFILRIIEKLPNQEKLAFTKTADEDSRNTPRFKVTLGVMPDYFYEGKGVKVDGVTEGKPGHAAGMQAGDIITKLGDYNITDMMSYMKALAAFEKGKTVKLEVERNTKTVPLEVTF
jgi:hypothetical protein